MLIIRRAEVDGALVDVEIDGGRIRRRSPAGSTDSRPGIEVIDAAGGAVVPGLWDHHLHLLAWAAALRSTPVGPPGVRTPDDLRRALDRATGDESGWVRAVGYHESVAGDLDRHRLDALLADRPVRVQHRSGALWILNSMAVDRLGLDHRRERGIERDADGRATGRIFGGDHLVRPPGSASEPPDLGAIGALLTRWGVTGVTDATPFASAADLDPLVAAAREGRLRQRVVVMGGPDLATAEFPSPLGRGPVKIVVADHALPALADLVAAIGLAHGVGRPVAVHCVSRVTLALLVAAFEEAGAVAGDRIEHGAVMPPELRGAVAALGLTVVTQPGFVRDRGDDYRRDVEADDLPFLYPCASLTADGIAVAGSTDAPFGPADPWVAMAAAVDRTTASGHRLGAGEVVPARRALELFLGDPNDPGGPPRRVEPGAAADLCLLDAPLHEVLAEPDATRVRRTIIAGVPVGPG